MGLGARTPSRSSSGASALQLALSAVGVIGRRRSDRSCVHRGPDRLSGRGARCHTDRSSTSCADTAALDAQLVQAARTDRTRAVMVVHLYGRPAVLPDTDLLDRRGRGAGPRQRSPTTRARRPPSTASTPPRTWAASATAARWSPTATTLPTPCGCCASHGMTEQYVHDAVSQNFRMSELEAAWLRLSLGDLARAQRTAARASPLTTAQPHRTCAGTPTIPPTCTTCACSASPIGPRSSRDMARAGVATAVHYPYAHHPAAGIPPPHSRARAPRPRRGQPSASPCRASRADRRRGRDASAAALASMEALIT